VRSDRKPRERKVKEEMTHYMDFLYKPVVERFLVVRQKKRAGTEKKEHETVVQEE
jgi:hypothetical protein